MPRIRAIGIDAAFANMGFAEVVLDIEAGDVLIRCSDLALVKTAAETSKTVRKSSDELRRAKILHTELVQRCSGLQLAFVEVPSGSQSASAARALGIAVGVLAACPIPIIEVSPMEVKAVVTGGQKKATNPTKAQVIAWAVKRWPLAPWLRAGKRDPTRLIQDNEHLADALATVAAGIVTPAFRNLLALSHEVSHSPRVGPAPKRRTLLRI